MYCPDAVTNTTATTNKPNKGSSQQLKKNAPDSIQLAQLEKRSDFDLYIRVYAFLACLAEPILFLTTALAVSSTTHVPPAFSMASLADLLKR